MLLKDTGSFLSSFWFSWSIVWSSWTLTSNGSGSTSLHTPMDVAGVGCMSVIHWRICSLNLCSHFSDHHFFSLQFWLVDSIWSDLIVSFELPLLICFVSHPLNPNQKNDEMHDAADLFFSGCPMSCHSWTRWTMQPVQINLTITLGYKPFLHYCLHLKSTRNLLLSSASPSASNLIPPVKCISIQPSNSNTKPLLRCVVMAAKDRIQLFFPIVVWIWIKLSMEGWIWIENFLPFNNSHVVLRLVFSSWYFYTQAHSLLGRWRDESGWLLKWTPNLKVALIPHGRIRPTDYKLRG